mgnify:CR=1 FL=1
MTFGTCYTGAGGFDLGLAAAGWTCRWQVEADSVLRVWLAGRWPGAAQRGTAREAVQRPPGAVRLVYGELPPGLGWPGALEPVALALGGAGWVLVEGAPAPWTEMRSASDALLEAGWRVAYRVVRYVTACSVGRSSIRQRVWMLASREGHPTAVCDAMGLDPDEPLERPAPMAGTTLELAGTPVRILEAARGFPAGWMEGLSESAARSALSEAASPHLGRAFAEAMRKARCVAA